MGVFEGRRAIVTGGASGIGLATAQRLTAEGARVAVVDVRAAGAEEVAADIGGVGFGCDVSDPAAVNSTFAAAARELGGLDLVHLNAGVTTGEGDITKLTDEQYRRALGVNVDGVVFGTRAAARLIESSGGGGAIVATASLAGVISYPPDPIYALTKHAVVGFVRGVGPSLEPRGITVNAVCPGIVRTPMVGDAAKALEDAGFPLLAPEDIAEAVVRAATSGRSGECWAIQPGREPLVFEFRNAPGPRVQGAEGMVPPGFDRIRQEGLPSS